VSWAKTAKPIEMPFWLWTWLSASKRVLDGGLYPPCEGAIIRGKDKPGHARRHSAVSCAIMLNWWTCHLGRGTGLGQVAPMCPQAHGRTYWRNMANTI